MQTTHPTTNNLVTLKSDAYGLSSIMFCTVFAVFKVSWYRTSISFMAFNAPSLFKKLIKFKVISVVSILKAISITRHRLVKILWI